MLISEKQVIQMLEVCKLVLGNRWLKKDDEHKYVENLILQIHNQQSDELVKVGDLKDVS